MKNRNLLSPASRVLNIVRDVVQYNAKVFIILAFLFSLSNSMWAQNTKVDILPKLYLPSRNTPENSAGWIFTDARCNNYDNGDYWKMINSTSTVTSPEFDITNFSNVEISITWQAYGSYSATKNNATIKISTGDNVWYTIGQTNLSSSATSSTTFKFSKIDQYSSYERVQIQISTPGADGIKGGRLISVEVKGTIKNATATYSVTYDANGGTGELVDDNSPYTILTPVSVLDNIFTRTGCIFSHWNTSANGSGTSYNAGDKFLITRNTTLYAQWKKILYFEATEYTHYVTRTGVLTGLPELQHAEDVDFIMYGIETSDNTITLGDYMEIDEETGEITLKKDITKPLTVTVTAYTEYNGELIEASYELTLTKHTSEDFGFMLDGEPFNGSIRIPVGTTNYVLPTLNNPDGLDFDIDTDDNTVAIYNNGRVTVNTSATGITTVYAYGSKTDYFGAESSYTIEVYEEEVNAESTESVQFGASGITTYCSHEYLNFEENAPVKAYIVKGVDENNNLTLQRVIGMVDEGTGLILKGRSNQTMRIALATGDEDVAEVDENILIAVFRGGIIEPSDAEGEVYTYIYGTKGGETGFFQLQSNYINAPKNIAVLYLETDYCAESSGNAPMLRVCFDEGLATAIEQADRYALQNRDIYSISGTRVNRANRGIYITNGRKVVI